MRGKEEIKTSRYTIRLGTLLLILLTTTLVAQAEVPCPNVILVMVDDMGYSDIGCYGGEIQTPNLDALAQGGLRFRQFYNTGKCHSSRVTLLSGLHSYQAGNAVGRNSQVANGNIARGVSIAEVLRELATTPQSPESGISLRNLERWVPIASSGFCRDTFATTLRPTRYSWTGRSTREGRVHHRSDHRIRDRIYRKRRILKETLLSLPALQRTALSAAGTAEKSINTGAPTRRMARRPCTPS